MDKQLSFFDTEHDADMAAKRLARRSDPATSQAAAAEIAAVLGSVQLAALDAVRRHPGCTGRELNALTKFDCHKRLAELERMELIVRGHARRCTQTGKQAATWRAK